jgi:hypothetical protein
VVASFGGVQVQSSFVTGIFPGNQALPMMFTLHPGQGQPSRIEFHTGGDVTLPDVAFLWQAIDEGGGQPYSVRRNGADRLWAFDYGRGAVNPVMYLTASSGPEMTPHPRGKGRFGAPSILLGNPTIDETTRRRAFESNPRPRPRHPLPKTLRGLETSSSIRSRPSADRQVGSMSQARTPRGVRSASSRSSEPTLPSLRHLGV